MPRKQKVFSAAVLRAYCLDRLGATEDWPFGPDVTVYRIKKKIFALAALEERPFQFNLKCDPDYARALRKTYRQITPGYHMNKRHWNTIVPDDKLPLDLIYELVDHSFALVAPRAR